MLYSAWLLDQSCPVLWLRIAAVLLCVLGLGFGVPCYVAVRSVAAGHGPAIFMGYPTYGGGPFERVGIHSSVPLLLVFAAVCALEVASGVLLWRGQVSGAVLALLLLGPGAVFWWGFALPYAWPLAAASTVLTVVGWRALH
jgi:hypothetical protein